MWANPRRQKQRSLRLQWRTWSPGRIFQVIFLYESAAFSLHATDPGFLLRRIRALIRFFDPKMLQVILNLIMKKAFWIVNFSRSVTLGSNMNKDS
jgi:hypothetical protein